MAALFDFKFQDKLLLSGQVPTVPTAPNHDDPSWLLTDIYKGQTCYSLQVDGSYKEYSRDDNGIFEKVRKSYVDNLVTAEANTRATADTTLQSNITAEASARAAADTALLDGVPSPGNTLQKLYNLVLGANKEITVANIATRDALNIADTKTNVFVTNDGDGNWALYKATSTGVGASFIKLSDPDLLNALMSAVQIKSSYESNSDTNAFTNALLSKLNGIQASATANSTDAQLKNRANHTGQQEASTISDLAEAVLTAIPLSGLDPNTVVGESIDSSDLIIGAIGKLMAYIKDIRANNTIILNPDADPDGVETIFDFTMPSGWGNLGDNEVEVICDSLAGNYITTPISNKLFTNYVINANELDVSGVSIFTTPPYQLQVKVTRRIWN